MPVVGAGLIGTGQAEYLDVVLQGGRTYSFSVHPTEPNVDFDLHIYDQNGNLVAWDESTAADAYGVVTTGVGAAMIRMGVRRGLLEARQPRRCPACGRLMRDRVCRACVH